MEKKNDILAKKDKAIKLYLKKQREMGRYGFPHTCDVCNRKWWSHDVDTVSINNYKNYMCPDCMWHFREMWGKLLEERRNAHE